MIKYKHFSLPSHIVVRMQKNSARNSLSFIWNFVSISWKKIHGVLDGFLIFFLFLGFFFVSTEIFFILSNIYLIPQIIHQSIKGQQIKPNNYLLYGLVSSRLILIVIFFYSQVIYWSSICEDVQWICLILDPLSLLY